MFACACVTAPARARAAGLLRDHAQAAAMRGDAHRLDHLEAVPRQERDQRTQRVIVEMLVIDGIELNLFDEVEQVRKLKCGYAVRLEQYRKSFGEIIDIRYVVIRI